MSDSIKRRHFMAALGSLAPGRSLAALERGKDWPPHAFATSLVDTLAQVRSSSAPLGLFDFSCANEAARARAFRIRYTFFRPARKPQPAVGETWAVCFDGEPPRRFSSRHGAAFDILTDRSDHRVVILA